MSPDTITFLAKHGGIELEMAQLLAGCQFFDMREALEIIDEVALAYVNSPEAWFADGKLPANKCIFDVGCGVLLYAELTENGSIIADVAETLHLQALKMLAARVKMPHFEPQDRLIPLRPDTESAVFSLVSAACAVLSWPEIVQVSETQAPRNVRRRAQRNGWEITTKAVKIQCRVSRSSKAAPSTGPVHHRALHFCRGFERTRNSKKEWVRGHWRGNPELGIHLHYYVQGRHSMINALK